LIDSSKLELQNKISAIGITQQSLDDQLKCAENEGKAMNKFRLFESTPETTEFREESEQLRKTLKMKNISLTILKNENTKLISDVDEQQKNTRILKLESQEKIESADSDFKELR